MEHAADMPRLLVEILRIGAEQAAHGKTEPLGLTFYNEVDVVVHEAPSDDLDIIRVREAIQVREKGVAIGIIGEDGLLAVSAGDNVVQAGF